MHYKEIAIRQFLSIYIIQIYNRRENFYEFFLINILIFICFK